MISFLFRPVISLSVIENGGPYQSVAHFRGASACLYENSRPKRGTNTWSRVETSFQTGYWTRTACLETLQPPFVSQTSQERPGRSREYLDPCQLDSRWTSLSGSWRAIRQWHDFVIPIFGKCCKSHWWHNTGRGISLSSRTRSSWRRRNYVNKYFNAVTFGTEISNRVDRVRGATLWSHWKVCLNVWKTNFMTDDYQYLCKIQVQMGQGIYFIRFLNNG